MDSESRISLKLFLTFFIIYFFFIHWGGWYENSIFALTRAIVDETRFQIDSYANQTSDRAFYNGHYYTEKAPGTSILGVPVYWTTKVFLHSLNLDSKFPPGNQTITFNIRPTVVLITQANPGIVVLISMILFTLFTSTLFSALTIVLIFKISRFFTNNTNLRIFVAFIYGLASLAFSYGTVLNTLAVGTFFSLFSFFFILKITKNKDFKRTNYFIVGFLFCLAFVFEFSTIIISICLFFYFVSNKIKSNIFIIIGFLIPFLLFILFNYSILGKIDLISKYEDRQIFSTVPNLVFNSYGFLPPSIHVTYQILFGSYRGLLFYFPIFYFSLIGLYYFFKTNRRDAILIFITFLSFVVFTSSRITWHGGYTFGPRYLLPMTPFLMVPLIFSIKKIKNFLIVSIFILFLVYSIIVNFAGLQQLEDVIIDQKTFLISDFYQQKINNFQPLENPLFGYYFRVFLSYGPRSRILENLLNGRFDIDIRDVQVPYYRLLEINKVFIPYISFLPIIALFLIFWRREILNLTKSFMLSRNRPEISKSGF